MVKRVFVFPGQGSQFVGMARDFFEEYKETREVFEEASDFSGLDLRKICFESNEEELRQTAITQPAILTASVGIFRALQTHMPTRKALFMGHSLGEYTALVCAGVMPLGATALLVHHRGLYMQEAVPIGQGAMAAVLFKGHPNPWAACYDLCTEIQKEKNLLVYTANQNSLEQIVISGQKEAVEYFQSVAAQKIQARRVVTLPVSAPFHSPLMSAAKSRLWPELDKIHLCPVADAAYIANVDAQIYNLQTYEGLAERLAEQIVKPVLWVDSVNKAVSTGVTEFFEVGPGAVLTGLCRKSLRNAEAFVFKNIQKISDLSSVHEEQKNE